MAKRNLTLSIPDDLVRRVKVLAAERDTSISMLVTELLEQAVDDDGYGELWAAEEELMEAGVGMEVGTIDWSRSELHDR